MLTWCVTFTKQYIFSRVKSALALMFTHLSQKKQLSLISPNNWFQDSKGSVTLYAPLIMLCNCVNNGTCVELTELEKSNSETRLVFLLVQLA